jgi:hypothetical protein
MSFAAVPPVPVRRTGRRPPHAGAGAAWASWVVIGLVASLVLPGAAALRSVWLAPLLEETVLRLGLHDALCGRLRGRAAPAASVLAALAFATAHLACARGAAAVLQAAATALPAWWIGRRYERGGRRLAPCVAWHAGFNLAWLGGLGALFSRAAGA